MMLPLTMYGLYPSNYQRSPLFLVPLLFFGGNRSPFPGTAPDRQTYAPGSCRATR